MHKTPIKRDTLTVSQLNRQAKRLLEGNFPSVWIEGEISNFSRPSSGHWYFSLKDSNAQLRCAMFRSSNSRLRFVPDAGQHIVVRAKLSLYEARGDYQLIVEYMEAAGDGALARAFEELKQKLQTEGLFNEDAKQELPEQARHIAVVTSATGAAIHDILTVLERRSPSTEITIFPTLVQGQGAADEIARAIHRVNLFAKSNNIDVLLLGRGGGSAEDLWAFNEEVVARAIYHSDLPVVSAVGHEVDYSIADFVADVRAPTPSAAAELLSTDQREQQAIFQGFEQLLSREILRHIASHKQKLDWLRARLRHPGSRLQEHSQRLDDLEIRLKNSYFNRLQQSAHKVELLKSQLAKLTPIHEVKQLQLRTMASYRQLEQQILQILQRQRQKLQSSVQLLNTVSPLATLERGYAIVTDDTGQVISESKKIAIGQNLKTRLAHGTVNSTVSSVVHDAELEEA